MQRTMKDLHAAMSCLNVLAVLGKAPDLDGERGSDLFRPSEWGVRGWPAAKPPI